MSLVTTQDSRLRRNACGLGLGAFRLGLSEKQRLVTEKSLEIIYIIKDSYIYVFTNYFNLTNSKSIAIVQNLLSRAWAQ